ncbi:MAG: hypothetical protein ABSD03_04125 [Vulcanimicrobiaceae bacterium]
MRVGVGCGLALSVAAVVLVACGGGGGGSPAPPAPTPTPSKAPQSYVVGGTVVQIPSDAYGPSTIDGVTYASADATQTTALAGATVIVGPVPIAGATPPAALPSGDVSTTTTASGAFSVTLAVAPAAPSSTEPFVVPPDNLSGFTPPATGYYVQVFASGADGLTAGVPIPLHRFVASSTSLALHVTSPSSAEAGALTVLNADRASNAGSGPLIFDEDEQEVARLHASDEATQNYTCHYDTKNVGPSSRYLGVGGIGLTGEALVLAGASSAAGGFQVAENGFLAEKTQTPPGPHYMTLVDLSHDWAGLAAVQSVAYPGFWQVDYDLGTSTDQGSTGAASGYPTDGACPTGIVVNNS